MSFFTIIHPSNIADTTNFDYFQVIVNGAGPYNVNFNGNALSLTGPNTFDLKITNISSGNTNVLLAGNPKIYAPKYLGNPPTTGGTYFGNSNNFYNL
jgi:hypothetical protein